MSPKENPLLAGADVPPDSSPADEGGNTAAADATPGPDAGNQSGKRGGKQEGRTLDNVAEESNRKIKELTSQVSELRGMLQGMQQYFRGNDAPEPKPAAAADINTMTSSQLEALKPNVPKENLPALEQLIAQRRQAETVRQEVDTQFARHTFAEKKRQAEHQAFSMYPELRNTLSRFRQTTNEVLNEAGESAQHNPYALLHAAQTAAARLGIKPSGPRFNQYGAPVGGGTAPPPAGNDGSEPISAEKMDKLATSLRDAMPGGKFTEEQLKRIQENSKHYRENKNLFIRQ